MGAYVKNPTAFVAGLNEVSSTADKLGSCVVYDFHQHYTSSYFEHGDGGFPSFLTKSYSADRTGELKFWDDYYHNNIIIYNGVHVWDLQSNFVRDVVIKNVDSHPSTSGYDLLNEPIIQTCSQFADVGNTQTYIGSKMRAATAKPKFFENAVNQACTDWNDPALESQALPRGVSNLVYAPHIYNKGSPTLLTSLHLAMLKNYFQKQRPGMPIYIGEWGQDSGDGINQDIMEETYLKAFKDNNVGWSYWVWDPLYDCACKTHSYVNTQYIGYLDNAMAAIY